MKKIEKQVEKVTKETVITYEASDGRIFKSEEECKKYEETAKMVVYNMIQQNLIGKTNIYDLFGEGNQDELVEIYRIDSLEIVELLNRYISLTTYNKEARNIITNDMVGKDIILCWSYDMEWCWTHESIDDLCNDIRKSYMSTISDFAKNQQGEVK